MVDTKKEQEREELHRAIWAIADDLRGAVDGWDFKSYVRESQKAEVFPCSRQVTASIIQLLTSPPPGFK